MSAKVTLKPALIEFEYTNYRGEESYRRVVALGVEFRASDWHPEQQWLMRALDLDKNENRDFAMKYMRNVKMTP